MLFLKTFLSRYFFKEKRTFQMHQDKLKNMAVPHSCHLPAFNELSQIQDQMHDLKCLSRILSNRGSKPMLDRSSVWDSKVGGTQDNQIHP